MDTVSDVGNDPGARTWLLVLAMIAMAASGASFAFGSPEGNLVGYILASLVAFTCVALFRRQGVKRAAEAGIAMARGVSITSRVLLLVGVVLSIAHAYLIGRHFG